MPVGVGSDTLRAVEFFESLHFAFALIASSTLVLVTLLVGLSRGHSGNRAQYLEDFDRPEVTDQRGAQGVAGTTTLERDGSTATVPDAAPVPDTVPIDPDTVSIDPADGTTPDTVPVEPLPADHAPAERVPQEAPTAEPEAAPSAPEVERPADAKGRLVRLRERLARSNTALGRGLLALLSNDTIDDDTWDEIEDVLIGADLGVEPALDLVETLKQRVRVLGTRDEAELKTMLAEELLTMVGPETDRSIVSRRTDGKPAVVLVVGVNGAGKTTSVGKLARVLVAQDHDVLLGAADTFRAAAADQLQTWGQRVGVPTVRSEQDNADAAAVAFDAVAEGRQSEADVVLIDTAGRLQNKKGLMDELGKVKRVAEKALGDGDTIDEVLLVLDATTGQNGLQQAKVFAEAVGLTGVVLAKLDGTAKGGIVVAIQRELGVPVKFVGLGEGPDDLAPFEPKAFVDAIVG